MARKERLELSMRSFMQRLATNDLVFMYVLRLGVTNVGCQRLLKVADFCPKAVHKSIVIYERVFVYFKDCKAGVRHGTCLLCSCIRAFIRGIFAYLCSLD